MRIRLLLLILLLQAHTAYTQNDLLVLKKKNRTIQTWVSGSYLVFQFSSKQWIQSKIRWIRNDSLLLDMFVLRQVPGSLGFLQWDTGRVGLLKLHVKEIYAMPKRDRSGIITNGALFQLGSGAFIFLNLANTLIKNEELFSSVNSKRLGIATGVFGLGTLLKASHKTYIVLGKRYRMETIKVR
jgi:hypothetical protein